MSGGKIGGVGVKGEAARSDCTAIAKRGRGMGSPERVKSPATRACETVTRSEKNVTRLSNGQFPKHVPACTPATQSQYDEACSRYIRGDLVRDIIRELGLSTWGEISERGGHPDNVDHWGEVQRLRQVCNAAAVEDASLEVLQAATGQEWESQEEGRSPQGPHSRTIRRRSAALLDSAAGKLMPAIHGRAAGRQPGAVVNIALLDPGHASALRIDADTPRPVRR